MLGKRQITKTDKSRKVLTEELQHSDRLDITDLLELEKETINNILDRIQEIPVDQATANYIYNLINISDMLLNNVCTDFLDIDFI